MLPNYSEEYVATLFDQMGPSYDFVNLVSSFGFSEIWRYQCVRNLGIEKPGVVADLMAGSGECWTYINRRLPTGSSVISLDFSRVMCDRQKRRALRQSKMPLEIRCENVIKSTIPEHSIDYVVSAFGLKTFDAEQMKCFARELFRILRPGGKCSLLEISVPKSPLLKYPYKFYIGSVIPIIGRLFLKNIDCYKMLGIYTGAFGDCSLVARYFQAAGFRTTIKTHFFGCASSLVLQKAA